MPNVASDLIPTKAGHLPGILTFLKSGNQVTLTDIRTMFDQVHPGSAADHFEPYGGGYKLTPRSGFVNLIGKYRTGLENIIDSARTSHCSKRLPRRD